MTEDAIQPIAPPPAQRPVPASTPWVVTAMGLGQVGSGLVCLASADGTLASSGGLGIYALVTGLWAAVMGVLMLAAGGGLLRHRSWARILTRITIVIYAVSAPFFYGGAYATVYTRMPHGTSLLSFLQMIAASLTVTLLPLLGGLALYILLFVWLGHPDVVRVCTHDEEETA